MMTSSCSLFTQDLEKCAPRGVQDALCQRMVLYHVQYLQLLNGNHPVSISIAPGGFVVKIAPLSLDLQVGLRRASGCFAAACGSFLAAGDAALLAPQRLLRRAVVARVLYRLALAIGQERCQPGQCRCQGAYTGGTQILYVALSRR